MFVAIAPVRLGLIQANDADVVVVVALHNRSIVAWKAWSLWLYCVALADERAYRVTLEG